MILSTLFAFSVITTVLIFGIILPLAALVDIVRSKFDENQKLLWIILVIFLSPIGTILYFTIGRKQKTNYTYTN